MIKQLPMFGVQVGIVSAGARALAGAQRSVPGARCHVNGSISLHVIDAGGFDLWGFLRVLLVLPCAVLLSLL
jgi:hypothetical protein